MEDEGISKTFPALGHEFGPNGAESNGANSKPKKANRVQKLNNFGDISGVSKNERLYLFACFGILE